MEVWWGSNAVYAGKNKATSFVLLLPCLFHTSLRVHVCVCVSVCLLIYILYFFARFLILSTQNPPSRTQSVSQSVSRSIASSIQSSSSSRGLAWRRPLSVVCGCKYNHTKNATPHSDSRFV